MSRKDIPIETLQNKATEAAEFMRLFSTPSRLMLLCHIAQQERSVGEIQNDLGLKQPALSQQLAELRQAGLVKTRRQSRAINYSIADERVEAVMDLLLTLFCGTGGDVQDALRGLASSPGALRSDSAGAAQFARLDPVR
ncbi:metalloregulator ArsR/SmtB family transcription factor (plasmid) [Ensifer adhaerens]|uniref:ArsR/SmtB family transcription factor n=1 Tax=Ensifer adhaerens TaxID=106592 RepID=UPI0021012465|nr:metalloregulator ArsR/SmtB family transcription factor [Ensifer adhaerens]UTV40026.1 metalloregulator ArsR/SmtB family transcription factor [Ensifer adhaerens]